MHTVANIHKMSMLVKMWKKDDKSIGLVPTMGYLHEGHISLVKTARKHNDIVVMSIFVNPLQFGPKEDYEKYPRNIKRDEEMANAAGVDVIFAPSVEGMYPKGFCTYVSVEDLDAVLCGVSREGHFRGVVTVVNKLFNIVKPDMAYFGQKDAQQAVIIKKMVEELNMGIGVKVMPTVREKDGLAMSSRNAYLSEDERRDAPSIYHALTQAVFMIKSGERDAAKIEGAVRSILNTKTSIQTEYVEIVDTRSLKKTARIKGETLIAVAVRIGRTRLIDNVILNTDSDSERGGYLPDDFLNEHKTVRGRI